MRRLLPLCSMLAFIAGSHAASARGPVKVFILAGQSNMEGQGVADLKGKDYNEGKGTLEMLMSDPAKGPLFKRLKDDETNLVNLIRDVRKELNAPRLPVVIGELTGPWVKAEGAWAALRKAQADAAAWAEFKGTVRFIETHDFVRRPEDSPCPGHGHHEFANAETYFLVGQALGEGMKRLLEQERGAARSEPATEWRSAILNGPIKAFCSDFNWGPGGPNGFAKPGLWADADPARHIEWYEQLGCNVIQAYLSRPIDSFQGNDRSIAALARFFNGRSLD